MAIIMAHRVLSLEEILSRFQIPILPGLKLMWVTQTKSNWIRTRLVPGEICTGSWISISAFEKVSIRLFMAR